MRSFVPAPDLPDCLRTAPYDEEACPVHFCREDYPCFYIRLTYQKRKIIISFNIFFLFKYAIIKDITCIQNPLFSLLLKVVVNFNE